MEKRKAAKVVQRADAVQSLLSSRIGAELDGFVEVRIDGGAGVIKITGPRRLSS